MSRDRKLIGAGILTAIASSLCCITPVLALLSGTSGMASSFSWMESYRPYLIGFTVLVLGYAWYQKLKPQPADEIACDCEADGKPSFFQSKMFLGIVTVFAIVMTAFPYYSAAFYPDNKKEIGFVQPDYIQKIDLRIKGMTCTGCEEHIKHAVNELDGIINVEASYENGNASVEFDLSKVSFEDIKAAVDSTGYQVVEAVPASN